MRFVLPVLALIVIFTPISATAQTASVIPLSHEDQQEARVKWETLQHAQEDWQKLQTEFKRKYTAVPFDSPEAGSTMESWDDEGKVLFSGQWEGGISYSPETLQWGHSTACVTPEEIARQKKHEADAKKAQEEYYKHLHSYRKGWEYGFEFSKDFQYIVPKATPPCPNGICSPTGIIYGSEFNTVPTRDLNVGPDSAPYCIETNRTSVNLLVPCKHKVATDGPSNMIGIGPMDDGSSNIQTVVPLHN